MTGKLNEDDRSKNAPTKKAAVLRMIRSIACAETEEEMEKYIAVLKSSGLWNESSKLRNWFGETWLPCRKVIRID